MVLKQLDKNTYIHRPNYEVKSISNKLQPVRTLSNNEDYRTLVPLGSPIINQPINYWTLVEYVKKTPELISPIEALVTDTISEFEFELLNPNDSPKKLDYAREFCLRNHLLQQSRNAFRDRHIYGNGLLVINTVSDDEIKSVLNTNGYEYKETDYEFKEYRKFVDEISYKNAIIKYMPAVTVSAIPEDKFGEDIKYKQVVGTESMTFDAKDIIHFKDVEYDGKIYGYSRIYSLKSEIQMLWNAKDYLGRFFDNNGTPNILFIAPNMKPNSPDYNNFVKQVEDMKKAEHKQKNMLSTSELKVEKLNGMDDGMQFRELLDYVTSLIAMTYQVPPTRVGIAGSANGEAVTLTNQGYYRRVATDQDYFEEQMNSQFFIPYLGVRVKLKRDYKEDLQREAIINKTKLDAIEQLIRAKLITREAGAKLAARFMNFTEDEIPTDEEVEAEQVAESNQFMQGQQKKTNLEDAPQQHEKQNKKPKTLDAKKK
jgi:hypothetical protein